MINLFASYLPCIYLYVGAQIIDLMILVIDITKGIQTQTAEVTNISCINVHLILCRKLLYVE